MKLKQTPPIIKPTNAAQGICLNGFRNSARPVIISKYLVPTSQTSVDQTAAPVNNSRIPTKKPKIDTTFRILLMGFPKIGVAFIRIAKSQAVAAIPPNISINGV